MPTSSTSNVSMLPGPQRNLAEIGTTALRVAALLSAVRDLIVRRVVEPVPIDGPLAGPSWLFLGSPARRDALPHSDVDTALAWPTLRRRYLNDILRAIAEIQTAVRNA